MYLLDTNVVSELRKMSSRKTHPQVAAWSESVKTSALYISVITLEEITIGTLRMERRNPPQGRALRAWLDEFVRPTFKGRVLEVDTRVILRSAPLHVPDPRPVRDMLIAATANVYGMTLVTRDLSDMANTGVNLLNPWEWAPHVPMST